MIGYVVTFGVMAALVAACWAFGQIARNPDRLSDEGEALWPHSDASWK